MRTLIAIALLFAVSVHGSGQAPHGGRPDSPIAIVPHPTSTTPAAGRFQLTPRLLHAGRCARDRRLRHCAVRHRRARDRDAGRKDYADFLRRLQPHLRRLSALDVNVRPLDQQEQP